MANTLTLTALTEVLFAARDIVAKEPTGFIQGCLLNTSRDGVSINGSVQSYVTPAATVNTSAAPAMTIPAADDYTVAAKSLTIAQTANVKIPIKGEDWLKLSNTSGYENVMKDMFAQAIRGIRNTIESHVGSIAQLGASRAIGTSGTTPFASTIDNIADVRQILVDNGVPQDGNWSLVLNTTAGTKLRKVPNLYKANEAGNDILLRRGELLNLEGFSIRESAGVTVVAAVGNGTSYVVNGATAKGATSVVLKTGSGTVVVGDVVTIGSYKYVVTTGVAAPGTIVIAEPGLMAAAADGDTVTINAVYTANSAFHRNAIELVMRPPAMPPGGDLASERMTIQDDTGLVFEVAMYQGYKMNMFDFTTYYQAKAWNTKYIATLLG